MASVINERNGRRRLDVVCPSRRREHLRLGKITRREAELFRVRVERLCAVQRIGHSPDEDTLKWLASLDDTMHARLAAIGLVREREVSQLGAFLEKYLTGRATELKSESSRKLGQTKTKLLEFFGERRDLRTITPQDASEWRQWLASTNLSTATVKIHAGNAKTIFAEAERRELVTKSPFRHLRGGSTASTESLYVVPEESQAIIDALPDAEWRLLFGLARYAGLRIPSESHLLTWADVDWDECLLRVYSTKLEHHPGLERRVVPIEPRLMKLLQDRFDSCEEGQEKLVTKLGGNVDLQMTAAIKRAGVTPWLKLFQALRSSCETEWKLKWPEPFVLLWIGHTEKVSRKHYVRQTPDVLWDQVTGRRGPEAAQNPAQQGAESPGSDSQTQTPSEAGHSHNLASDGVLSQLLAEQGDGGGENRTPVPKCPRCRPLHA